MVWQSRLQIPQRQGAGFDFEAEATSTVETIQLFSLSLAMRWGGSFECGLLALFDQGPMTHMHKLQTTCPCWPTKLLQCTCLNMPRPCVSPEPPIPLNPKPEHPSYTAGLNPISPKLEAIRNIVSQDGWFLFDSSLTVMMIWDTWRLGNKL